MTKETLLSIFIGIIITYIFYLRTKKDTKEDTSERRKADKAIILTRDPAHKAVFDEENKIKTITVEMSANMGGFSKLTANAHTLEKGNNDVPK